MPIVHQRSKGLNSEEDDKDQICIFGNESWDKRLQNQILGKELV